MTNRMQAQYLMELAAHVARAAPPGNSPYSVAVTLKRLIRTTRRLATLDLQQANGEGADYDNKTGALEERLTRTCADLGPGFGFVRNRDPRGCAVYLRLPSGATNDIAGRGLAIW